MNLDWMKDVHQRHWNFPWQCIWQGHVPVSGRMNTVQQVLYAASLYLLIYRWGDPWSFLLVGIFERGKRSCMSDAALITGDAEECILVGACVVKSLQGRIVTIDWFPLLWVRRWNTCLSSNGFRCRRRYNSNSWRIFSILVVEIMLSRSDDRNIVHSGCNAEPSTPCCVSVDHFCMRMIIHLIVAYRKSL